MTELSFGSALESPPDDILGLGELSNFSQDAIICFSTIPADRMWLPNPVEGSHFITTFVDAMIGRHEHDDLATILVTMTSVLTQQITDENTDGDDGGKTNSAVVQLMLSGMQGRVFWR